MKPSQKLYKVIISSIEEGLEYQNYDSKTVVATSALHAASRIRLVKTKNKQTFINLIEKIADIDRL